MFYFSASANSSFEIDSSVCVPLQCQCELPESYEAYRKQQHRWHSGPMQLFRLCLPAVIRAKVYLVFRQLLCFKYYSFNFICFKIMVEHIC